MPAKIVETSGATETKVAPKAEPKAESKVEPKAPKMVEVKLNVKEPAETSAIHLLSGRVEFVSGVATVTESVAAELKSAGHIK